MTGGTNQQFMIVANHEKAGVYSVHDLYNQRSAIGAIEERKGGRNITYPSRKCGSDPGHR